MIALEILIYIHRIKIYKLVTIYFDCFQVLFIYNE